jgi:5-(carboxyamino)imidazole ribonucleotide mutase
MPIGFEDENRSELDVLILMGSESDMAVMEQAMEPLRACNLSFEMRVCSAHRYPEGLDMILIDAKQRNVKVVIAGAGMAAHLPGVIASKVTVPVIGVPIVSIQGIGGLDALYSIVQMPPGIPVACVAINGAKNAGILAAQIIAPGEVAIYRQKMKASLIDATMKKY